MGKTQETIKSTKKIKDPIERVKNQKANIDRAWVRNELPEITVWVIRQALEAKEVRLQLEVKIFGCFIIFILLIFILF